MIRGKEVLCVSIRYQIVYTKGYAALSSWSADLAAAVALADRLLAAGYLVNVWQHTPEGSFRVSV